METLGYIFVVLLALVVLGAILFALLQLPSLNRYRRIRRM